MLYSVLTGKSLLDLFLMDELIGAIRNPFFILSSVYKCSTFLQKWKRSTTRKPTIFASMFSSSLSSLFRHCYMLFKFDTKLSRHCVYTNHLLRFQRNWFRLAIKRVRGIRLYEKWNTAKDSQSSCSYTSACFRSASTISSLRTGRRFPAALLDSLMALARIVGQVLTKCVTYDVEKAACLFFWNLSSYIRPILYLIGDQRHLSLWKMCFLSLQLAFT